MVSQQTIGIENLWVLSMLLTFLIAFFKTVFLESAKKTSRTFGATTLNLKPNFLSNLLRAMEDEPKIKGGSIKLFSGFQILS